MKKNSFFAFVFTSLALLVLLLGGLFSILSIEKTPTCKYCTMNLDIEETEIELENCQGKLVKLIINNGNSEDEYKITVNGPKWIYAKPEKIRLSPNEQGEIFIYLSPEYDTKGDYKATINVKSWCSEENIDITVKV